MWWGGEREGIVYRVRRRVRGRLGLGLRSHTRPFVQATSNPFRIRRLGLGLALALGSGSGLINR
jgi:hypothetical protein